MDRFTASLPALQPQLAQHEIIHVVQEEVVAVFAAQVAPPREQPVDLAALVAPQREQPVDLQAAPSSSPHNHEQEDLPAASPAVAPTRKIHCFELRLRPQISTLPD
jgi:hypothetical protein